jgi:hypothetical protein
MGHGALGVVPHIFPAEPDRDGLLVAVTEWMHSKHFSAICFHLGGKLAEDN